jgi:hypothetical protein
MSFILSVWIYEKEKAISAQLFLTCSACSVGHAPYLPGVQAGWTFVTSFSPRAGQRESVPTAGGAGRPLKKWNCIMYVSYFPVDLFCIE